MLPLRKSLQICEEYLTELYPPESVDDDVMVVRAEFRLEGWLFYYQATAFLNSGDFRDALGGNNPILVTTGGEVKVITFNQDIDEVAGPLRFSA